MPKDLITRVEGDYPENYVEADKLLELLELVGSQRKVCDMLGASQSTVSRAKQRGRCAKCYELAAEAHVRRIKDEQAARGGEAEKPAIVIGSVSRADLEIVNRALAGFGVSLIEIEVPV